MDNESEKEYVQRLESLKISRLTGTINLNDENILKSIITSKSLIEIAKSYLNTNCISINATYFISNPIKTSEEEKYSNAQYFHWDNDFVKFLNFIFICQMLMNLRVHMYLYLFLINIKKNNIDYVGFIEMIKFCLNIKISSILRGLLGQAFLRIVMDCIKEPHL